jgi:putative ABC transport system ATP-binding protein
MENVAQIINVQKVYRKGKEGAEVYALRGVTTVVPRGQYMAIMGPSGSGKSTLMNILGCLDRPTDGQYILEGRDVASMNDTDLSRARGGHIGFVFQAFNLIPQLTLLQNVEVPLFYQGMHRFERRRRAQEAIARVSLTDRGEHRPAQLSGGQMQRTAIARALVNRPSFLLADEPTGNLDSVTGHAILDIFDELHDQGLTIIIVTHDEHVAKRCQRVIRLQDGLIDRDEAVLKLDVVGQGVPAQPPTE